MIITLFVQKILEGPRTDPSPILGVTAHINCPVVQIKARKKISIGATFTERKLYHKPKQLLVFSRLSHQEPSFNEKSQISLHTWAGSEKM